MTSFYNEFTNLEQLGYLHRKGNNDLWILHKVYLPIVNKKLIELKIYYNNHLIRTAKANSPNQLYVASTLCLKVMNTSISEQTIDILHNWQNEYSLTLQNNVTIPSIEEIIMNEDTNNMVDTILRNQNLQSKSKYINIRAYLRELN